MPFSVSTSVNRRHQRGQAIVLIAIMLAILVGMAALAIDGSRAYALRRDVQAALDSAILAAGDTLQQTGSYTGAEKAATAIFGTNLRLYTAPSCAPGYGSPGAAAWTVTCTFSDGTVLKDVVSDLGPQGGQFAMTASRSLVLQFARILTNGVTPTLGATATARVDNLLYSPALAALDLAGCGGVAGSAITVSTGGTVTVIGDVVSNGSITGPGNFNVAGDVYARCQAVVPGVTNSCYPSGAAKPCTYPDVAGATRSGTRLADPGYRPPTVVGGSQAAPGSTVVLNPGVYSADPNFASGLCYFLSSGVYQWQAGYTNSGSFVSNELKPPDEPDDDFDEPGNQLWDTGKANCAGSFQVTAVSGAGLATGSWAVEVTSTRTDSFNGTSYVRESAPSYCKTVAVGSSQGIKVQISNVPGATGYNVYFDPPPSSCRGQFGYGGSIAVAGAVRNNATAACPAFSGVSCSLGNEGATFDATALGAGFSPNGSAAPGVIGAYPPDGEGVPLKNNDEDQNAPRATPPAGDRANENQCDTIGGALTTCPGPVTPGAVAYYIPNGGCLNATSLGDNFLFGGYQYDWILVYEPGLSQPPANTCANTLGAFTDSAYIGLIYLPAASITVKKVKSSRTDLSGGLIADTITFSSQLPTIIYSPDYAPAPPASKLVA